MKSLRINSNNKIYIGPQRDDEKNYFGDTRNYGTGNLNID